MRPYVKFNFHARVSSRLNFDFQLSLLKKDLSTVVEKLEV